jgi:hypothetical protein
MKLTGENRQLGEKPVLVPICPPQISHGLDLGSNPGLRGERPATMRLSHGTVEVIRLMVPDCTATESGQEITRYKRRDIFER